MRRAVCICGAFGFAAPAAATVSVGRADPRVPDILTALNRAVAKLEEHDSHKADTCNKDLDKSKLLSQRTIDDGSRFIKETSSDLATAKAEVDSIKSSVDGLKAESRAITEDIAKLTAQLRDLRAAHSAEEAKAKKSLQQLDAAITQAAWQDEQRSRVREHSEPRKLSSDVSLLKRLGRELSSDAASEAPAASFLQVRAAVGGSVEVLKADLQALLQARVAEADDLRKKEKELMDLIESKRAQLGMVEGNLNSQQPILAEKSKVSAELEDSISFSKRDVKQLQALRDQGKQTCDLREERNTRIDTLRDQLVTTINMAGKWVSNLDAVRFLNRDLSAVGNGGVPAFLQLDSKVAGEVQRALQHAAAAAVVSVADSEVDAKAADASDNDADLDYASASDTSTEAQAAQGAGGPFDKVQGMIRDLIADLRSQGNQDVDQNTFCLNSLAENDRSRVEAKVALDEASTQIVWARAAVDRLDRQIAQLKKDGGNLEQLQQDTQKDAQAERLLVAAQLADLGNIQKSFNLAKNSLRTICKAAFFVQGTSHVSGRRQKEQGGNKIDACKEAVTTMEEAGEKIAELTGALQAYQKDCASRDDEHARMLSAAVSSAQGDTDGMKGNRARRANELAVAEADHTTKKSDLALVSKAAQEIASQCSVQESADQRMAKRQEQLDSLKSALRTLNGQEVP